ncbi:MULTISPECIES: FimB/Mfa2 family fimbrial subunit [unclassified Dysgonomonas]|uniref:FimB/Mfa2 family fimbrial subunit n=1 Tax=unclassified Dysgonomonas TaxID=2630389 RepID=UPI0025BB89F1|nr:MULTISPECIES: FimB/Mfa2 family fimbrial subunit [unclassified Dysgonomonas]HMM03491.1 FimB/Mfa2 family fimbrial subunit [Dysgonomonas sp.]
MKININKLLLFTANCLLLSVISCTRVDLEDPLKGKMTLVTDWSKRTSGIEQPASYMVIINNQTLNYTQATNILPELEAGNYPIYIYNSPDRISITGTTAAVTMTGNLVDPLPGWLFTATTEARYADFKEETITVQMRQQVRQLTIELTVTEGDPKRIASTSATLTGIANSLDYEINMHSGTNLSIAPSFTRDGNKLTATVRLLGMANETKKLILDITFTDGETQHIESDVSAQLVNFNQNKHVPLTISGNLNTPEESGFAATITGWKVTGSSSGVAW